MAGYGIPELDSQQREIERRQRVADAMAAQGMQPLETNQMAGGYVVPVSPLAALAKMAQTYAGKTMADKAAKDRSGLDEKYNEGLATAVREYMAGGSKTVQAPDFGAMTGGLDQQDVPMRAETVQADPRERVVSALTSKYAPVRDMAKLDYQMSEKKAERADNQAFRAQESALARDQRRQDLELRLQDQRLNAADRAAMQRELAQMNIDARRDMASIAAAARPAPTPVAVMGPEGKPIYVSPADAVGKTPFNTKETTAKLPTPALKLQQEELDAIGTAGTIDADLGAILKQVQDGKIKLGPVSNVVSSAQNALGLSDESSRNLASFKATLEKLRNDSLRLNKGVQTEGDAQRAWNEILSNINDPELVKQRLGEVQAINKRAANLRRMNVDTIRSNFGVPALDTQQFSNQPAAVGNAPKKIASDAEFNALPSGARFIGPDNKERVKP